MALQQLKPALLCATFLVIVLFAVTACHDTANQNVTSSDIISEQDFVSLSDTSIEFGKGISMTLSAEGNGSITWSSSDETIATVSDGVIKGENVGHCVVTAHSDSGAEAKCDVEVKKTCYLTFDDGPNDSTAAILDVLKEYDVPATFFVVGSYYLELTKQMQEQGCLVGIHTNSHYYDVCYRSANAYYSGVEKMARRVEAYTGERPTVIRFPGGTHNTVSDPLIMQRVVNGAKDLGYRPFDWTATSGDSSQTRASSDFTVKNIKETCTEDVEIVLMHDRGFNVSALRIVIPYLREQGYVFETLDHYPDDSYTFPSQYSRKHQDIPSQSVKIGLSAATLKVGQKITLAACMSPSNSTDYIRWESADSSLADVMPDGTVEALLPGEVDVFAITSSGQQAVSHITIVS